MNTSKGISLVELLTTLCICSLLVSLATPAIFALFQQLHVQSTSQRLLGSLTLARQHAISRNENVILLPRGGTWQNGWALFIDRDNDGVIDQDEPTLLEEPATRTEIAIHPNQTVANYIRYAPDGRAYLRSGAFQAGSITICHHNASIAGKKIVLNSAGRLRQSAHTCP
jgi:type IV fimbrial biogenesis protein FimT